MHGIYDAIYIYSVNTFYHFNIKAALFMKRMNVIKNNLRKRKNTHTRSCLINFSNLKTRTSNYFDNHLRPWAISFRFMYYNKYLTARIHLYRSNYGKINLISLQCQVFRHTSPQL